MKNESQTQNKLKQAQNKLEELEGNMIHKITNKIQYEMKRRSLLSEIETLKWILEIKVKR